MKKKGLEVNSGKSKVMRFGKSRKRKKREVEVKVGEG